MKGEVALEHKGNRKGLLIRLRSLTLENYCLCQGSLHVLVSGLATLNRESRNICYKVLDLEARGLLKKS